VAEAARPHHTRGIYYPEDTPQPPAKNFLFAIQHVVAMFGSTALAPILMGFDPNLCILCSGIATMFFYFVVGAKIPSYLGSSFSFIAAVTVATHYSGNGPNPGIATALSGIVFAGFCYALMGLLVWLVGSKFLERLVPPLVTGSIVAVIGLNLAPVAVKQISGSTFDTVIGLLTIILVAAASALPDLLARLLVRLGIDKDCAALDWVEFSGRIPILLGGALAYVAYALITAHGYGSPITFADWHSAPWFAVPHLTFANLADRSAWSLIGPVSIVLVAENLGHVQAIGVMTGRKLDKFLWRAFLADGVATMGAGLIGGTGVTTYAENMGAMNASRNFSATTCLFAGSIAFFLGFVPKFGALLHTIPTPIIGGLSFVLFGMIAATAGRIWTEGKVDFSNTRNLIVIGVALVMGAGDLVFRSGAVAFGGIATATFSVIILYHIFASSKQTLAM
jgi:putative pyrimidine permease RutG